MQNLTEMVNDAVRRIRVAGTDVHDIEVKKALGGAPKSLPETISAFANGVGGLIILGLDEDAGFIPVGADAQKLAVALGNACADSVEPPIRATVDIVHVDSVPVAVCLIPELGNSRKPCFVKTQGLERGSYIRGHDGDRHLTTYEIHSFLSLRGQPHDDQAIVDDATIGDLDESLIARLLERLRRTRSQIFTTQDDVTVLRMVGVLGADGVHPTLAGLIAVGVYPQQFFPQLDITFVAFPTVDGRPLPGGTRFLDNMSIDGSIPTMIDIAESALMRNMTRAAAINGAGREDILEYPLEAVRELIVNAIMHRDYHPLAQGTQIRMEMYPDRLAITSPGGIFGAVDVDALTHVPITSSRNSVLGKLLEDVEMPRTGRTVAENRGSGLIAVSAALEDAEMKPARITSTLSRFTVELFRRQSLTPRTDHDSLTPQATGSPIPDQLTQRQEEVMNLLQQGPVTTVELSEQLGITRQAVLKHLTALKDMGLITPIGNRYSKNVRWEKRK
jgi:ATP-dependent DNA helicase RecG